MQFYLYNKKALFDSAEAHKAQYGEKGLTVKNGAKYNTRCSECNCKSGTLRVTCKRMTNIIKFKETDKSKQISGKVMEFDMKKMEE